MKYILTILIASLLLSSCTDSVDRSDPEDVVRYFFQSKVDGNEKWKEVLPPSEDWSDQIKFATAFYEHYEFTEFEVLETVDGRGDRVNVKLFFKVKAKDGGKEDRGEDDCALMEIDGKWTIVRLPA